ncbi:hypothetical protein Scep_008706 [Stephania cephalantha]|uniref:Uncharacterized protein n=1 Tax=Stephania cephalantha TaxID=152367 RepID=A0AAP0JSP5_9MAGN
MGVILINQTNCVLFVSVSEDDDEDLFTVPDVESRPPLSNTNTNSNSNSSGKRRTVRNPVDREYGKLKRYDVVDPSCTALLTGALSVPILLSLLLYTTWTGGRPGMLTPSHVNVQA